MTRDFAAPEIVEAPARTVVAVSRDYRRETRDRIPRQWEEYFASGQEVPGRSDTALYGVSYDVTEAGAFSYGVGVAAEAPDPLPAGMCRLALSPGPHAVFRHAGPMSDIPALFDHVFETWLPASDWEQAAGPVYERYTEGEDGMRTEIWVPVRPRAGS